MLDHCFQRSWEMRSMEGWLAGTVSICKYVNRNAESPGTVGHSVWVYLSILDITYFNIFSYIGLHTVSSCSFNAAKCLHRCRVPNSVCIIPTSPFRCHECHLQESHRQCRRVRVVVGRWQQPCWSKEFHEVSCNYTIWWYDCMCMYMQYELGNTYLLIYVVYDKYRANMC